MGLCGDYKGVWDKSTTQKDLVNIAADINGADFLCASVAKSWGLTKDYIRNNFKGLINGSYVARCGKDKGYTSEIYVVHKGDITVRTTILIVLYSDVTIHVPINHVCRIFSAGNTKIDVQCDGNCELIDYTPIHEVKYGNFGRITFTDPHKDPNSWINFNSQNEQDKRTENI